jgi:hypothetical protein
MPPQLFDLTWKSSTLQPELPTGVYPYLAPAIYRGDPYTIRYLLLDGVTPYVPTGQLVAQIRPARFAANATPGVPLAEWAVDIGGDDGNEVTQHLTPAQTETLPDNAFWDIQEFDGDEPLGTWFTGKVKAWGDITREDAA